MYERRSLKLIIGPVVSAQMVLLTGVASMYITIPTGNRRARIIPTIHGLCYRLVMSATMMAAAMLSFPTVSSTIGLPNPYKNGG